MTNPYHGRPDYTFWRQGVAEIAEDQIDPVVDVPFTIGADDRVATAGSCFAQHLSRTLRQEGFRYLVTEAFEGHPGTVDEGYGTYPARFGNIYTSRQLLQLFDRAYGLFRPHDSWCLGHGGAVIDPFRPRIQAAGYPSSELLEADRHRHFAAVRGMFEQCDVFIFTLGLTEYWASTVDGAVFPLPPAVSADMVNPDGYAFGNLTVTEILGDLEEFIDKLREVNPRVKMILTVSPVPLVATYENRHVLVSTIASKAALRAAADEFCRTETGIAYFPSYEIVTGPQAHSRYYGNDLREVTAEGVAHVMAVFKKHLLRPEAHDATARSAKSPPALSAIAPAVTPRKVSAEQARQYRELSGVVCDEEALIGPADLSGTPTP